MTVTAELLVLYAAFLMVAVTSFLMGAFLIKLARRLVPVAFVSRQTPWWRRLARRGEKRTPIPLEVI